ncbi:aldose 1-epimerase family protein [Clostridium grantii]|uniref:Galactose mutarotase n=1 Tax=Clostridium grantii DSM 8605 TaxID=1121316 RepID=A0A1M5WF37_9CLOT|nr:aldose 1-epimerase family protein [Clostridium grantii]SHH86169.1 protein of unknown function [Clostridium grantii DSM 8605]
MKNNPYIGHSLQLSGVEEHRLIGGKGDGMRLFEVRNGLGLAFTVSLDRCADISRLSFKGDNYGYFSQAGYVSPAYYDGKGEGFLKSFTGGFLTTCGLSAVGVPCVDEGEELPLHGSIGNTPAEHAYWTEDDKKITINAVINQSMMFSDKLILHRKIICSKIKNEIVIEDTIENVGDKKVPCMILYHMNIGYPLLSEKAKLEIPSIEVKPRNDHAAKDIGNWNQMLKPQVGFEEQCYYHLFNKTGMATIYNSDIKKGLKMTFDANNLDYFVQWKMMAVKDYVLGLEPGNCHADGRNIMRKDGTLKYLNVNEQVTYQIKLEILEEDIC